MSDIKDLGTIKQSKFHFSNLLPNVVKLPGIFVRTARDTEGKR